MRRLPTLAAIIGVGVIVPVLLYVYPSNRISVPRELHSRNTIVRNSDGIKMTTTGRKPMVNANRPHMNKICQKYRHILETKKADVKKFYAILYNDQYKVLYCQIPKVATTNWRRMFLILSGKFNTTDPSKIAAAQAHKGFHLNTLSELDPQEIQFRLKNYLKFMVVREPFERLLSAYRNKLGAGSSKNVYFHTRYGKGIIKNYRKNPSNKSLENGHDVTFAEFVEYILDPKRKDVLNAHWLEYHELCLPCIVNYNHILRYETLTEDSNKIIDKIGASDILKFPSRSAAYHHPKTSSFLYDYYKTLSQPTLSQLFQFYHLDFAMFNYTLPSVLQNLTTIDSDS